MRMTAFVALLMLTACDQAPAGDPLLAPPVTEAGAEATQAPAAGVEGWETDTSAYALIGATGLTAYFGMLDVGRPQPGDTVAVSDLAFSVLQFAGPRATRWAWPARWWPAACRPPRGGRRRPRRCTRPTSCWACGCDWSFQPEAVNSSFRAPTSASMVARPA